MPFSFPASLQNLKDMLQFVRNQAKAIGFRDDEISKIELATEEALVNIIKYAYPKKEFKDLFKEGQESAFFDYPTEKDEARGQIEIDCSLPNRFGLKIEILDRGVPFDPCHWEKDHRPQQEGEIGGLGLLFIFNFMDEVKYHRQGETNILTLIKYLSVASVAKPGN